MSARVWQRLGPDGVWTTELDEPDRLAVLGIPLEQIEETTQDLVSDEVKSCRKCGLVKPLGEFGVRRDAADGRQSYCRPCKRNGPEVEVVPALDETNSRICRSCYRQVPRGQFVADSSRPCGLARICTPCTARKAL